MADSSHKFHATIDVINFDRISNSRLPYFASKLQNWGVRYVWTVKDCEAKRDNNKLKHIFVTQDICDERSGNADCLEY